MTRPAMPIASAIARSADAEVLHIGESMMQLLLDSSATGGALTAHRTRLSVGELGANPHLHRGASELFYVLDGVVQVLAGDRVLTATTGDAIVIPPQTPHAFAAAAGSDGELLVVLTPGVERFEFFRDLRRMVAGTLDRDAFLRDQARYDTYGVESTPWQAARGVATSQAGVTVPRNNGPRPHAGG